MTPDSQQKYRAFARLCRILTSGCEPRALFQEAATEVHALTGCDRVSLIPASRQALGCLGLALEFAESPRCFEISAPDVAASAVPWVLEHRQPLTVSHRDPSGSFHEEQRLFEQGYRACLYVPLLCRGEV